MFLHEGGADNNRMKNRHRASIANFRFIIFHPSSFLLDDIDCLEDRLRNTEALHARHSKSKLASSFRRLFFVAFPTNPIFPPSFSGPSHSSKGFLCIKSKLGLFHASCLKNRIEAKQATMYHAIESSASYLQNVQCFFSFSEKNKKLHCLIETFVVPPGMHSEESRALITCSESPESSSCHDKNRGRMKSREKAKRKKEKKGKKKEKKRKKKQKRISSLNAEDRPRRSAGRDT